MGIMSANYLGAGGYVWDQSLPPSLYGQRMPDLQAGAANAHKT
jgi:hypothetical protein